MPRRTGEVGRLISEEHLSHPRAAGEGFAENVSLSKTNSPQAGAARPRPRPSVFNFSCNYIVTLSYIS